MVVFQEFGVSVGSEFCLFVFVTCDFDVLHCLLFCDQFRLLLGSVVEQLQFQLFKQRFFKVLHN